MPNFTKLYQKMKRDKELTFLFPLPWRLCRKMKKPTLEKEGDAVGWKRFRAVTSKRSDFVVLSN
jgi:hypothetical protein